MTMLLAIFSPGPAQILIFLAVVLLLFGHRLPSTMRSLGKGITEFKKGLREEDDPEETKVEDKRVESNV